MKKIVFGLCLLCLICISSCALAKGDRSTPNGIVCTSVTICEILDKLEIDNVIGVPTTSSKLPERYKNATNIGGPMSPDMELISSLNPEIILSPSTLEYSLKAEYSYANIESKFLDLSSVDGLYSEIEGLGNMFGKEEKAQELILEYNEYMSNYIEKNKEINVLVLMSFPNSTYYLVSTEDSYVGSLVKLAGANNVYGTGYVSNGTGVSSISPEDIVKKDTEIGIDKVLVFGHYGGEEAFDYIKSEFNNSDSFLYRFKDKVNYLPSDYGFGMSADFSWTSALEYLKPLLYGVI